MSKKQLNIEDITSKQIFIKKYINFIIKNNIQNEILKGLELILEGQK